MIRVSGLTKDYGPRRAIENLTFHAEKGEIVGFLGPNGAGKTTTMRILSGFMPPSAGKAEIGGFDVLDNSLEVRKLVGYLPETVPLYNDMTVSEYLKYMADLRKLPNSEERVDAVLEMVHMTDRANGYIGKLSKGMRQRIGLAQALIHEPPVLILDEPTIGLDPAQIIEVRQLIQDLGKERTILLSTHILSEAQQICNRVLIINKGHIVAEDLPNHLQARLTGSQKVTVVLQGEVDDVLSAVQKVPGVLSVIKKDDTTFEFETSPSKDARPEVAKAIVKAGVGLLELHPTSLSLEEIFLQLTRDEPSAPEIAEPTEAETAEE